MLLILRQCKECGYHEQGTCSPQHKGVMEVELVSATNWQCIDVKEIQLD